MRALFLFLGLFLLSVHSKECSEYTTCWGCIETSDDSDCTWCTTENSDYNGFCYDEDDLGKCGWDDFTQSCNIGEGEAIAIGVTVPLGIIGIVTIVLRCYVSILQERIARRLIEIEKKRIQMEFDDIERQPSPQVVVHTPPVQIVAPQNNETSPPLDRPPPAYTP
eukprot:TRINITY_DN19482_c0_g1_i1.p1 TRINITY_DN19482_c0_g1~~TRINITY_DN19482_c0_g1_i1.p1  ORF type:complete len:179 (-),score=26.29 TRINITY_DN19482_c0_g1_i1:53-547(-)